MDLKLLIEKTSQHFNENLPFVLFIKPDEVSISSYFQKTNKTYTNISFSDPGVVIAPFHFDKNEIFIPKEHSDIFSTALPIGKLDITEVSISETKEDERNYIKLVEKALNYIEHKATFKVVTSRKKSVPIKGIDFEVLINRLFSLQSTTFRYIWFHPKTGLWCGATPETLLILKDSNFSTMSLAGTKKIKEGVQPDWTYKERIEQKYVTDAIADKLQKITPVLKISKPYSHKAGTLVHLRTDFQSVIKRSRTSIECIANTLHPTPAICGTPNDLAKSFILKNEGYDRSYYTGFIGAIDETGDASLFVNLRCMQLTKEHAKVYVGGGVVSGSVPEDEWMETHYKLQTMLQVLKPMLSK